MMASAVRNSLAGLDLDNDIVTYICDMFEDEKPSDVENMFELVGPFLIDSGIDEGKTRSICKKLYEVISSGIKSPQHKDAGKPKKLSTPVKMYNSAPTETSATIAKVEDDDEEEEEEAPAKSTTDKKPIKAKSKRDKKRERKDRKKESQSTPVVMDEGATSTHVGHAVEAMKQSTSKAVSLRGVTMSFGGKELLDSAQLKLEYGHRYGLIGKNGVGKSTLLRYMAEGKIAQFPVNVKAMLVQQEIVGDETPAIEAVMAGDVERERLLKRQKELEKKPPEEVGAELADIYSKLEEIDSDGAEARASSILTGLQFSQKMQKLPTSQLSGGWRMRVALARALFVNPDLLLLDEPTNHLDLHAILWLQEYIIQFPHTLIVVSHDRTFLNAIVTDIILFQTKKLKYYPGNYDSYKQREAEKLIKQQRKAENEERQRKHITESIEKYKQQMRAHDANHSMGMVRSRKIQLEKLGGPELIDGGKKKLFDMGWVWGADGVMEIQADRDDSKFKFKFPKPSDLGVTGPILQLKGVSFGYPGEPVLLKDITMDVDMKSRIALLGPNGVGKSTVLKLIVGEAEPKSGEIYRHHNLKIAYFAQHHVQQLDLSLTPLQAFMKEFPGQKEETLRAQLGSCGLGGKLPLQPISTLSGGQKSRVVFARITLKQPHILVLDEPTNHLDFESIEALIGAVNAFEGGVMMVSHDQNFIANTAKELYVVGKGRVKKWNDSFEEYVQSIVF